MKFLSRKRLLSCGILLLILFAVGWISGMIPIFLTVTSIQMKVDRLKSPEKFEAMFAAGINLMRKEFPPGNPRPIYYERSLENKPFEEYVKKHPELKEMQDILGKDTDIISAFIIEQNKEDPSASRLLIAWGGGFVDLDYTIYGNPFGKIGASLTQDGETRNSLSRDYGHSK